MKHRIAYLGSALVVAGTLTIGSAMASEQCTEIRPGDGGDDEEGRSGVHTRDRPSVTRTARRRVER